MPDEFQLFCDRRYMISHLVAIELSETACLSALLLLKKRYQIGSIRSATGTDMSRRLRNLSKSGAKAEHPPTIPKKCFSPSERDAHGVLRTRQISVQFQIESIKFNKIRW